MCIVNQLHKEANLEGLASLLYIATSELSVALYGLSDLILLLRSGELFGEFLLEFTRHQFVAGKFHDEAGSTSRQRT